MKLCWPLTLICNIWRNDFHQRDSSLCTDTDSLDLWGIKVLIGFSAVISYGSTKGELVEQIEW